MRAAPDHVPDDDEELDEERGRVGFALRPDRADDLAGEPVKRLLSQRWRPGAARRGRDRDDAPSVSVGRGGARAVRVVDVAARADRFLDRDCAPGRGTAAAVPLLPHEAARAEDAVDADWVAAEPEREVRAQREVSRAVVVAVAR